MPPKLLEAFKRFSATVNGFSVAQKTLSLIGVGVLIVGIVALSAFFAQPSYAPLFTGLSATDASAITTQLTSDKVAYQLADGGATILVAKGDVYSERLKAAAAGLPSTDTNGYSLLDKMGVTTSEFQQNVTYKRAMEGELANTIMAMKGVTNASVKLAIPTATVFTDAQQDPTASVFIQEAAGVTLTPDQVSAVVHLVSASITGMKASDVSVIDANGNVLSTVGGGIAGDGTTQEHNYDAATEGAVQTMLDQLVGTGNSTVVVHAAMSNATSDQTSTTYAIPKGSPTTSESSSKEVYNGTGGSTAAGVLGANTNSASNQTTTTTTPGDGSYTSTSGTKDNALNTTTRHDSIPSGALQKQSVSVAVDRKAANGMSQSQLQKLVASAAGVDVTRGDIVNVQLVNFSSANKKAAQLALAGTQPGALSQQMLMMIGGGALLLILILLGLVIGLSRRRKKTADTDTPATLDEGLFPTSVLPETYEPQLGSQQRRSNINALAEADPAAAAEALRAMMDRTTNS